MLEKLIEQLLKELGQNVHREGLEKTPERVAKALRYLTSGYDKEVKEVLNDAMFVEDYDEMVIVKDIDFFSLCVPSKQIVNAVGGAKPAREVKVGDRLWTLDQGYLKETGVTQVTSRKTREIVEVRTTGGSIRLTPDHPVMTESGWQEAQALQSKDAQAAATSYAQLSRAETNSDLVAQALQGQARCLSQVGQKSAAISVLTEENYFQRALDHLKSVRQNCSPPILRKDFVFDTYQLYEAAIAGADAVLLIVALLDSQSLCQLYEVAQRIGLDVLVEVHDAQELKTALECDANIIGINNRDLKTFKVDLQTTLQLAPHVPDSVLLVSESGITTADDIRILRNAGCDAFLVGELFMKSPHPGKALRELMVRSFDSTVNS